MDTLNELLKEIDNIVIENVRLKLEEKIRLINLSLDFISTNKVSENDLILILDRVNRLSFEIGSSKAFESSNIELPLVLRACKIAEENLAHKPNELIPFLQLKLSYMSDVAERRSLEDKIQSIESSKK
jgi:hypothetical protein